MSVLLQTQKGQSVDRWADRTQDLFDHTRDYPIISIVPGILETTLDTACAVSALATSVVFHLARVVLYPTSWRGSARPLAQDSYELSKKFFTNASIGAVSVVPIIGNMVAHRVKELKKSSQANSVMVASLAKQVGLLEANKRTQ